MSSDTIDADQVMGMTQVDDFGPPADAPPPPEEPPHEARDDEDDQQQPRAVHYKTVDVGSQLAEFQPLEKCGNVYVAKLARPLWVQTPPLTLVTPMEEGGEPQTHAVVRVPAAFARFARGMEERVLEVCVANKGTWFRRAVSDASLRTGFKSFCPAGDELKIRVPRDALVFDTDGRLVARAAAQPGTRVRCILELAKVCFGRTEFGAMWSLLQAQTLPAPPPPPPPPRCLIDTTFDDAASEHPNASGQHPPEVEDDLSDFL